MKWLDLWIKKVPISKNKKPALKIAHIVVQAWSQGPKGEIHISADCRSAKEVEEWADLLIHNLQEIKRKAQRNFKPN
jgi:hypothetical protein